MIILGIETSCDETAAALVENGQKILSNEIASSEKIHEKTGGIIPEVAARKQLEFMIPVLEKALQPLSFKKSGGLTESLKKIDALAVTVGPGLIGSLLVGVETAKTISAILGIPLIPVNHILAHIFANWLNSKNEPDLPALCLVASGGHSELYFMNTERKLKWLGGTLDDAAGEAFDKISRLVKLGYPGGPAISKAAENYRKLKGVLQKPAFLPRPMADSNDFNFSFSGLKTAATREIMKKKGKKHPNEIAYEAEEAITDVLTEKTYRAARKMNVRSIILGGGVSANKTLRKKIQDKIKTSGSQIKLFAPKPELCTDNAAQIACFAYYHLHITPWQEVQANPDLNVEV